VIVERCTCRRATPFNEVRLRWLLFCTFSTNSVTRYTDAVLNEDFSHRTR
jgi:hypothetical protein